MALFLGNYVNLCIVYSAWPYKYKYKATLALTLVVY